MKKRALIKWISEENGGRRAPVPIGTKYAPIISFQKMKEHWSCVFTATKIKNGISKVRIEFLVDNSPIKYLKKGNNFELYEGIKKVADGEIL